MEPNTVPDYENRSDPATAVLQSDQSADGRIGVFICDCGRKIAGCLDTQDLSEQAAQAPGVHFTHREAYPCSKDGLLRMGEAISERKLNRVLVAGCTPRLVEKLFKQSIQAEGLDPAMLEIVDIREQCANVHPEELDQAQQKALDLIEMGVARLANLPRAQLSANRVVKSAIIVGSSLAGLTAALSLAHVGFQVTVIEPAQRLGDLPVWADENYQQVTVQQLEELKNNPEITTLLNARIEEITGGPGDYDIRCAITAINGQIERSAQVEGGVILVASPATPQEFISQRWVDRSRIKTQIDFAQELSNLVKTAGPTLAADETSQPHNVVMIFCAGTFSSEHCSRLCCLTGIQQAIKVRQRYPETSVTVLFRDLFLGGPASNGEALFQQAVQLGVTFFRYPEGHPPVITDQTVDLPDPLTGETIQIPSDRIVLAMPLAPQKNARQLATLLHLPQDQRGFIMEPRVRLRPGNFADDGIFVLGGSHQPGDLNETLFQAYLTSARAQRFLNQDRVRSQAPAAQLDPRLCTGCGECEQACLAGAIHLEKRPFVVLYPEILSVSHIDPLRCTGCGSCAVACPVKAITIPGWEDTTLLAEISAVLHPPTRKTGPAGTPIASPPRVLVLACEWSAYAAADIAGAHRQTYPANIRILRMNCSARFDPNHILWAFLSGAEGVFLGACPPGDCHYGGGNLQARERIQALKLQLSDHGIDPQRLHLEFLSADDGAGFVQAVRSFTSALHERNSLIGGTYGSKIRK